LSRTWEAQNSRIRLRDGVDFKKNGPKPSWSAQRVASHPRVTLDWYPKLQTLASVGRSSGGDPWNATAHSDARHLVSF
jgi:hypothetical protein